MVEPGTPEDLGRIVRLFTWHHPWRGLINAYPFRRQLQVIGSMKTPFAVSDCTFNVIRSNESDLVVFQVKSGGHATNPGFSSTKGVHIYTGKFSQVTYDPTSGTVVIGSGLIWDTVYQRLQEHNVSVLGGRVTGVSGRDSLG